MTEVHDSGVLIRPLQVLVAVLLRKHPEHDHGGVSTILLMRFDFLF